MFQLRFPPSEIAHWAQRYSYAEEDGRVERAGSAARERGYLRRSEFLALCRWKTPRTAKQCASNSPQRIREASELAFGTADERVKIGVLRLLAGVEWPTASVLLHFCDQGHIRFLTSAPYGLWEYARPLSTTSSSGQPTLPTPDSSPILLVSRCALSIGDYGSIQRS